MTGDEMFGAVASVVVLVGLVAALAFGVLHWLGW